MAIKLLPEFESFPNLNSLNCHQGFSMYVWRLRWFLNFSEF